MKPIKVGVVGYGIAAQVMHLPFLSTMKEYEVVSILERHRSLSQEKFPQVRLVRSLEEMLDDPSLELVVITTPNDTHFPYATQVMQAGKHVVVEKPFTITSAEAAGLVELSKKTQKICSIYQNRRYVGDFLTVRQILDQALLGEVVEYEAHYDRYRPEARPNAWREENKPGSGILYDLGAHLIDQALCLFGLPKAITADLRRQRPHARIDDYFDLRLDYGFNKAILHSSMLAREHGPRFMVHGTKGSFLKYFEDPQEAMLRAGVLPNIPHWGEEAPECWGTLHTEIEGKVVKEKYPTLKGSFGLYYLYLYQAIREGKALQVRPEHGFNTIRTIELALESAHRKCTVECHGYLGVAAMD